jgi:hypothetical protein
MAIAIAATYIAIFFAPLSRQLFSRSLSLLFIIDSTTWVYFHQHQLALVSVARPSSHHSIVLPLP